MCAWAPCFTVVCRQSGRNFSPCLRVTNMEWRLLVERKIFSSENTQSRHWRRFQCWWFVAQVRRFCLARGVRRGLRAATLRFSPCLLSIRRMVLLLIWTPSCSANWLPVSRIPANRFLVAMRHKRCSSCLLHERGRPGRWMSWTERLETHFCHKRLHVRALTFMRNSRRACFETAVHLGLRRRAMSTILCRSLSFNLLLKFLLEMQKFDKFYVKIGQNSGKLGKFNIIDFFIWFF